MPNMYLATRDDHHIQKEFSTRAADVESRTSTTASYMILILTHIDERALKCDS